MLFFCLLIQGSRPATIAIRCPKVFSAFLYNLCVKCFFCGFPAPNCTPFSPLIWHGSCPCTCQLCRCLSLHARDESRLFIVGLGSGGPACHSADRLLFFATLTVSPHVSRFTFHVSRIMFHVSRITFHASPLTFPFHTSPFHISPTFPSSRRP